MIIQRPRCFYKAVILIQPHSRGRKGDVIAALSVEKIIVKKEPVKKAAPEKDAQNGEMPRSPLTASLQGAESQERMLK